MSISNMDYVLRVLLLLQSMHICQAGKCQIEYCQICTPAEECSVCELGRFGQKCEYECQADSSTCSLCRDNFLRAFKSEAECFGCKEQEYFSKGDCLRCPPTCVSCVDVNSCSECYDGFFGITCLNVCPENCQQCSSQDVCTSCKEDWSGSICQCSSSCLQEGNQFDWCNINGTCLKGCVQGKRGIRCDADCPKKDICLKCDQFDERCLQCSEGLYGSLGHCDKACGHCKPNKDGFIKCNVDTGQCDDACVDGFYGRRCDQKCAQCLPDEFGVAHCDIDTGNCTNDCVDGFYGSRCDKKCEECTSVGNRTSETGECMDGFYGRFCDQNCTGNCFDPSAMSNECDKISGNCTFGCIHGWYGDMCEKYCSTTCLNTSCDQLSGKCNYGCIHGWFGDTCQEKCSNTCLNGKCSDDNTFCFYGCVLGWYGATCNAACSKMCFNKSCDQQFGHCDYGCVSGFYGDMCDSRCSDNCENGICDRQTSQCSSGCETGFEGPFCNNTQPLQAHFSPDLIGIVSGVAAVMTLFVCMLISWLLVRLRIKKYYGLSRTTRKNSASVYDEIHDNVVDTIFDADSPRTRCNRALPNIPNSSKRCTENIYDLPVERNITPQDVTALKPCSDNTSMQLEFPVLNAPNSVPETYKGNDGYEIPLTAKCIDSGPGANVCCGEEDVRAFSIFNSSKSSCVKEKHFSEQFEIPDSNKYIEFGYAENNKTDQSRKFAKTDKNNSKINISLEQTSDRHSCDYIHPIS